MSLPRVAGPPGARTAGSAWSEVTRNVPALVAPQAAALRIAARPSPSTRVVACLAVGWSRTAVSPGSALCPHTPARHTGKDTEARSGQSTRPRVVNCRAEVGTQGSGRSTYRLCYVFSQ